MENEAPTFSIPGGFQGKPSSMFKKPMITVPKSAKSEEISTRDSRFFGKSLPHNNTPRGRGGHTPRGRGHGRRLVSPVPDQILSVHEKVIETNIKFNKSISIISDQLAELIQAMQNLESRVSLLEDPSTTNVGIAVQRTLDKMRKDVLNVTQKVEENHKETEEKVETLWNAIASQSEK